MVSAGTDSGPPHFFGSPRGFPEVAGRLSDMGGVGFHVVRLGRARLALTVAVTLALAAVACTASVLTARTAASGQATEADRQSGEAAEQISRRMDQYVEVLRGLSGWIGQAGWPSRNGFHDYLRRNDVIRRYPGVQVVGAAELIDRQALPDQESSVRADLLTEGLTYPDYHVHPATTQSQTLPIDYVEPVAGNEPAFGFDLLSEERRRTAATSARDLGTPAATTPLQLVQDTVAERAILVIVPVYKPVAATSTVAQRQAAFAGVVYAGVRMRDLVNAIMPDTAARVRLFDAGSTYTAPVPASPAGLLYEPADPVDAGPVRTVATAVAGRRWSVTYRALIVSATEDRYTPLTLGGIGVLLALLAGAFLWATSSGQSRAEARAQAAGLQLATERAAATRRMSLLLDCSGEGIYGIDLAGDITFVNRRATELLGAPAEDLLGRNAHDVMHHHRADGQPYPVKECPIYHSLHSGQPCRVADEVLWRADGTALPVEYSAAPLIGDTAIEGAVITFSDITLRKRTEQALLDAYELEREGAQRLRELDQTRTDFVSTVSHELRTPLTSIGGYLEIILDGDTGPVSERQRSMIAIAQRNCQRLLLLVEDLLTLSRIEAATFNLVEHPVPMNPLLDGVARTVEPLAAAKAQRFTVDVAADCGTVLGDAPQLERVVLNLLSNAVKFTPPEGTITLRAARDADELVIAVADTGIGIPEAEQGRLFERFFRSTTARDQAIQGTGLGLSIVRNIVEQHGGSIAAESGEGAGTTMTIHLPLLLVPAALTE
jgi:PAS domain S-box-containing protein